MKELPIEAKINFKAVEDDSNDKCCDCCFLFNENCHYVRCNANERKDGRSVKFVRVEKGGAD